MSDYCRICGNLITQNNFSASIDICNDCLFDGSRFDFPKVSTPKKTIDKGGNMTTKEIKALSNEKLVGKFFTVEDYTLEQYPRGVESCTSLQSLQGYKECVNDYVNLLDEIYNRKLIV